MKKIITLGSLLLLFFSCSEGSVNIDSNRTISISEKWLIRNSPGDCYYTINYRERSSGLGGQFKIAAPCSSYDVGDTIQLINKTRKDPPSIK